MNKPSTITLGQREFRGSRLRCLQLTSLAPQRLRVFLETLVSPHATVPEEFYCMPRGFLEPSESMLSKGDGFPAEISSQFAKVRKWWLARPARNIPNWDLVSTCEIDGKVGLILVEAKAHEGEFEGASNQCTAGGANLLRIPEAIGEADRALKLELPGIHLWAETFYQLSNRFAFSWKMADLGVPVILIYLGFLDAEEMSDGSRVLLRSARHWEDFVKREAASHIPPEAWGQPFCEGNFTPLIRSARVNISAEVATSSPS